MAEASLGAADVPLDGLVYVVTGGAGALGAAVVRTIVARGATVHVFDRVAAGGTSGRAGTVSSTIVDLTDERAVTAAYAALERLDGSIHCAGGFAMKPITETSLDDFQAMWRMNTVSCFLACREAVRTMRRSSPAPRPAAGARTTPRGWIVNVAARPALLPVGGMAAYAASKAAVANLTQTLAAELLDGAGGAIMVNAVLPSIMDTPANRAAMPDADHSKWPGVDDVAAVIRALASPSNRITSGALVPVYGAA